MIGERRVIDAFKSSDITCVALVDDAFDPPAVPEEQMGAALDLLTGLQAGELAPGVSLSAEEIADAILALNNSEYSAESLLEVIARLYAAYVATDAEHFDPGGAFKVSKGNNLGYVRPILSLLRKCGAGLEVITCGAQPGEMDAAVKRAHLIFVDFFLSANLGADGDPSEEQKAQARAASITRLRGLIDERKDEPGGTPAVILMSSHEVEHRMKEFREEISQASGDVFAARFDFLQKKDVSTGVSGVIEVKGDALESLLGIVQSFAFGHAIYLALQQWKMGANNAVEQVWRDINALTMKDFAYLTRFRLAQEGMNLSEYLEWFFSECVSDAISRAVDWNHASFKDIDRTNGPVASVRGAFDGPTNQIAAMYDRVRVEKPRSTKRRSHRMGDLFVGNEDKTGRKVRAILTPDCDLIVRGNGSRKAPRVLTVGGVLRDIHAADAPLADFLLIDGQPQCVRWDLKDVRTYDWGSWAQPGSNGRVFKFLGTLKPIYAYELRARVLDDIGRFGLNVPPAFGASASARVIVNGTTHDFEFRLAEGNAAACSLVLSRGGADTTQAIFYERAVATLISALAKIDANEVPAGSGRTALEGIQRKDGDQDKLMASLTAKGVSLKETVLGIGIVTKAVGRGSPVRPWCQIVLSNELIGSTVA